MIAACLLATSCRGNPLPPSPSIHDSEDLLAALRAAGARVDQTAILPFAPGLAGGRAVFVGGEQVDIFEAADESQRAESVEHLLRSDWPDRPPAIWSTGRIVVLYRGSDGATIALLSGLLGEEIGLPDLPTVEPYPPAVAAAIGWLAQARRVDPGSIAVLGYAPADWPDACLGRPQSDEACAQVLTPGWEVRLEIGGEEHVLRTDALGGEVRPAVP